MVIVKYNDAQNKIISITKVNKELSNKVTGKVEVIATNKVGFYNVKVGADWYGTGSKSAPSFSRGDEISFDVEVTDKGFKNAKNISVAAPVQSVHSKNAGPKPPVKEVDWDLKDRKIQQQSARNAAIEFIGILANQGAIVYKASAKEKDKVVVLEALLEHYTEKFLNDTTNVGSSVATKPVQDDLSGEE